MWILFVHVALAIVLFSLVNWIGKHSSPFGYMQLSVFHRTDTAPAFNYFYRFAAPLVFILLVSSLLYALRLDSFVKDIYRVVIYYFLFRVIFNLSFQRALLLNWKSEVLIIGTSTIAAYQLYEKIISSRQRLFPNFESISNELWIIILVFLYGVLNNVRTSAEATEKRKARYLRNRYRTLSKRYGSVIQAKATKQVVEALIYAILIYESFNRPWIVRGIERLLFQFGVSKTLGIMQVTTNKKLSDDESVGLGVNKVVNDYNISYDDIAKKNPTYAVASIQSLALDETIMKYNPNSQYLEEVLILHEAILEQFYVVPEEII